MLKLKLHQPFRQYALDLIDGKESPRARLDAVTERQVIRIRLARGEFVQVVAAVAGLTLAIIAHRVEEVRVRDPSRIVVELLFGKGDPRVFWDKGTVFQLEGD